MLHIQSVCDEDCPHFDWQFVRLQRRFLRVTEVTIMRRWHEGGSCSCSCRKCCSSVHVVEGLFQGSIYERVRLFQEGQRRQPLEQSLANDPQGHHVPNQEEETSHEQRGHEGGTSQNIGATSGVVSSKSGAARCRGGPRDVGDVARVDQP